MDVLEAIRARRTTKAFKPEPVPRELIEQVLEAAVWAPNHRLTEPWEFIVVQGEALERLALLRAEMTADFLRTQRERPASPEHVEQQGQDAYRKALAAPVTIAVAMAQHQDPQVREEDYAATAIAIQNLMLTAHSLGLATALSTNRLIRYPPAYELLGVPAGHRIVGLVQIGHPAQQRSQRRTPAVAKTRWLQ